MNEGVKECKICKEVKSVSAFYDNKSMKDGKDSYCRPCKYQYNKERRGIAYNQHKKKMTTNPEHRRKILENKKQEYRRNIRTSILSRAKNRAKKFNWEFNLTIEDIIIPSTCPILEVPLIVGTKGNYLFAPSLDRVDNTKGYVKGNVKIISMLANSMKNTADKPLLYKFIQNLPKYLQQDEDIVLA